VKTKKDKQGDEDGVEDDDTYDRDDEDDDECSSGTIFGAFVFISVRDILPHQIR